MIRPDLTLLLIAVFAGLFSFLRCKAFVNLKIFLLFSLRHSLEKIFDYDAKCGRTGLVFVVTICGNQSLIATFYIRCYSCFTEIIFVIFIPIFFRHNLFKLAQSYHNCNTKKICDLCLPHVLHHSRHK